jgi:putative CocE/NonD family hydrolase
MKKVFSVMLVYITGHLPLCAQQFLQTGKDSVQYIIQDSVLIKTNDGATLSAIVVRKKDMIGPQPTALNFTIYAQPDNHNEAKRAAAYGYVGVVAYSRGKGLSPDEIVPYEHEVTDVNAVIDWIIRQPWSNGKVGMYGGSYNGFSQWAATKHLHPALKTIVPYVAAIPGLGSPMENNVFLNANYGWAFYVGNNKYLDDSTYNDRQRWFALQDRWYASGAAYRKIDSIDGTPNKWLQRWLLHPDYDAYWQNMVPYEKEYAKINIPVLTITGYYDDGQISAMHYLKEHYKYNPRADHYLIIGPYDHFGAQRGGVSVLRGYKVDESALINTRQITFEWLDHVLKGFPKPALLKDKINFQVMGSNTWMHVPSLEKMHNGFLTLYLTNTKAGNHFQLDAKEPFSKGFLNHEVDFADRTTVNNKYYPYPIITDSVQIANGLSFISEPFNEPVTINGLFQGSLRASINKKDMDIGVVLYEIMPDGRYFHLSYYLGRASYSHSMSKRKLLKPGVIETIPFERTRMVSRRLSKGSRLLVLLNVNKNPHAQINYGTGKNVSDETIQDAKVPLQIKWYNDSYIKIPLWNDKNQ